MTELHPVVVWAIIAVILYFVVCATRKQRFDTVQFIEDVADVYGSMADMDPSS